MQTRPSPTFGRPVHLRGGPHRLRPGTSPHALRIPSHDEHPALRRITPPADDVVTAIFGYGAPHSSARGTSTLPNNALLSAHYGPLRHPIRPGLSLASCQLIPTAITAGASRVASGLLCVHAIAITPAGSMELVRSSIPIACSLPCVTVRSAPAIVFSRPAQRSLTLWPARSPSRQATLYTESSDSFVASAAASIYRVERTSSRAGVSPAEVQRLSRRTVTPTIAASHTQRAFSR